MRDDRADERYNGRMCRRLACTGAFIVLAGLSSVASACSCFRDTRPAEKDFAKLEALQATIGRLQLHAAFFPKLASFGAGEAVLSRPTNYPSIFSYWQDTPRGIYFETHDRTGPTGFWVTDDEALVRIMRRVRHVAKAMELATWAEDHHLPDDWAQSSDSVSAQLSILLPRLNSAIASALETQRLRPVGGGRIPENCYCESPWPAWPAPFTWISLRDARPIGCYMLADFDAPQSDSFPSFNALQLAFIDRYLHSPLGSAAHGSDARFATLSIEITRDPLEPLYRSASKPWRALQRIFGDGSCERTASVAVVDPGQETIWNQTVSTPCTSVASWLLSDESWSQNEINAVADAAIAAVEAAFVDEERFPPRPSAHGGATLPE